MKKGFALIEIIVAILIIGIMIGLSIPRFFSAGNISLQKFVTNLNFLMQEGVSHATNDSINANPLFNWPFSNNLPLKIICFPFIVDRNFIII